MQLGEAIRRARAGKSQSDLAREAGLNPAQVSQIESGQRADPQFSTVVRLAKALGVSLDSLADSAPRKVASPLEQRLHDLEQQVRALSPQGEAVSSEDNSIEKRLKAIEDKIGKPSGKFFGPDQETFDKLLNISIAEFLERVCWTLGPEELANGAANRIALLNELAKFSGIHEAKENEKPLLEQVNDLKMQLNKVIEAQLLQQEELESRFDSSPKPLREADGTL